MLKLKLELEKKTYDILSCYYSCYNTAPLPPNEEPQYDDEYQETQTPASISWNMKAYKIDQELLDWCTASKQSFKNGKITIFDADTNLPIRILSFENAFCASFNENFEGTYDSQQLVSINLSAEKISVKIANAASNIASAN